MPAAMDRLRIPLLIAALVVCGLIVGAEIGANWLPFLRGTVGLDHDAPGIGIPSLMPLDGLLLFTTILMAMPLLLPERVHGKTQGCVTLIISILVVLGSLLLAIKALLLLAVMVSLLLAAPFGTIAYLALWGTFPTGPASTMLGALIVAKIIFAVLLVFAHHGFLKNKGLVLLILTTLLAYLIIAFLHAFVPMPLVSITDAIGGLIALILAIIWAIVLLIFSIPSIFKAVV